jgi:hypothetical protein
MNKDSEIFEFADTILTFSMPGTLESQAARTSVSFSSPGFAINHVSLSKRKLPSLDS